jgi:hypothetical protein
MIALQWRWHDADCTAECARTCVGCHALLCDVVVVLPLPPLRGSLGLLHDKAWPRALSARASVTAAVAMCKSCSRSSRAPPFTQCACNMGIDTESFMQYDPAPV